MDYQDRIGDRLDHPERVLPEHRHLIADDQQRVARILSVPVSGVVLDVGCSDRAITDRIREKWRVLAIGADIGPRDGMTLGWDAREPYPDGCGAPFDVIYCCEVLEHLTDADVAKAVPNLLAVLKPGGDLIVTVPNRTPHDLYEVGCRSRWAWPDHRSAWTEEKLWALFRGKFKRLTGLPLYDGERPGESIWLMLHAQGKR